MTYNIGLERFVQLLPEESKQVLRQLLQANTDLYNLTEEDYQGLLSLSSNPKGMSCEIGLKQDDFPPPTTLEQVNKVISQNESSTGKTLAEYKQAIDAGEIINYSGAELQR